MRSNDGGFLKMKFQLALIARDRVWESRLMTELKSAAHRLADSGIAIEFTPREEAQVVLVDGGVSDLAVALDSIDRKGRAVFLIVDERHGAPAALLAGRVDDVLVHPLRPLEVLSRLFHYQQLLMWDEVSKLNASFSDLLDRLREDLRLAERLQKSRLPQRFPDLRGLKISSRYLAGTKSGGDYFDLAEAKDGTAFSVVLSDASSYGLSSSLLAILMKVAMRLTAGEVRSCAETVRRIHEELKLTLGAKDKLSLFYGVVSRKDYRLRFLNLGASCAFYAKPKSKFEALPAQGLPIAAGAGELPDQEGAIPLEPEGRLVLVSDGFLEAAGGTEPTRRLLDGLREKDPSDSLNELVFKVKSKFESDDDMPAQDCTAIVVDLDPRLLRLA